MPITYKNHTHFHILSSAALPRRPLAAGCWLASVLMTWRLRTPAFGINGLCRSTTGPLDTFAPVYADATASNRWSMGVTALTNLIMRTNDGHQVQRGGGSRRGGDWWHNVTQRNKHTDSINSHIEWYKTQSGFVVCGHGHTLARLSLFAGSLVAAGDTGRVQRTQHKTCSSAVHTSVAAVGLSWNKKLPVFLIWQPNAGRTTHFTSRHSTDTRILSRHTHAYTETDREP